MSLSAQTPPSAQCKDVIFSFDPSGQYDVVRLFFEKNSEWIDVGCSNRTLDPLIVKRVPDSVLETAFNMLRITMPSYVVRRDPAKVKKELVFEIDFKNRPRIEGRVVLQCCFEGVRFTSITLDSTVAYAGYEHSKSRALV